MTYNSKNDFSQIKNRLSRAALFRLSGRAGFTGHLDDRFRDLFGLGDNGIPSFRVNQFFPIKQCPFARTLETGEAQATVEGWIGNRKSFWHTADSLVPVGHLILPVLWQRRHQDHIR
jgi:hypothetical protein